MTKSYPKRNKVWTGARNHRFGMVIASCSGKGGAALSRRNYGENIDHMTHPTRYFYQLVALMAPRPLLLQTGTTDNWSDPKGEFLSAVVAGPVYELLGKKALGIEPASFSTPGSHISNMSGYSAFRLDLVCICTKVIR